MVNLCRNEIKTHSKKLESIFSSSRVKIAIVCFAVISLLILLNTVIAFASSTQQTNNIIQASKQFDSDVVGLKSASAPRNGEFDENNSNELNEKSSESYIDVSDENVQAAQGQETESANLLAQQPWTQQPWTRLGAPATKNYSVDVSSLKGFSLKWQDDGSDLSMDWAQSKVCYVKDDPNNSSNISAIEPYCAEEIFRDRAPSSMVDSSRFQSLPGFNSRFFYETYAARESIDSSLHVYSFASCELVFSKSNSNFDEIKSIGATQFYIDNNNVIHYKNEWLYNDSWYSDANIETLSNDGYKYFYILIHFNDVTNLGGQNAFYAYWTQNNPQSPDATLACRFKYEALNYKDEDGNWVFHDIDSQEEKTELRDAIPSYTGKMGLSSFTGGTASESNKLSGSIFASHYIEQNVKDYAGNYNVRPTIMKEKQIVKTNGDIITGVKSIYYGSSSGQWNYVSSQDNVYTIDKSEVDHYDIVLTYHPDYLVVPLEDDRLKVSVNMYDYDSWVSTNIAQFSRRTAINSEKDTEGKRPALMFVNGGKVSTVDHGSANTKLQNWNTHTGDYGGGSNTHRIRKGIFANKLNDDLIPVLNDYGGNDYSLSTRNLFDSTKYTEDGVRKYKYKHNYTNISGLFDKEFYDETGYYMYASNDMTLPSGSQFDGHFVQLRYRSDDQTPSSSSQEKFNRNNFVIYKTPNGTSKNPRKFLPWDNKDDIDDTSHDQESDFHFGMGMHTTFLQPKDGKTYSKKGKSGDQVFYFNGDDDVVVYADKCLMLEVSGIHRECAGSINFATGVVKTQDILNSENKPILDDDSKATFYKIKDYYLAANPEILSDYNTKGINSKNYTEQDEWWLEHGFVFASSTTLTADHVTYSKVRDDIETNNRLYRYKDFSTHDLDFYYLERGGGASNCTLAFNLEVLPEGTAKIAKEIDNDGADKAVFDESQKFYYRVDVAEYDATLGQCGDYHPIASDGSIKYDVYELNGQPTPIRTEQIPDENGCIWINANQYASVLGYKLNSKFRVGEVDASANPTVYNKIDALWDVKTKLGNYGEDKNAEEVEFEQIATKGISKGLGLNEGLVASEDLETSMLTFKNSPKNLFDLKVYKQGEDNETSTFQVLFKQGEDKTASGGTEDGFVPYSNGKYTIGDDSTVYNADENGNIDIEDDQYIVLHNVQMGTKARLIAVKPYNTDDIDYKYGSKNTGSETIDVTHWEAGLINFIDSGVSSNVDAAVFLNTNTGDSNKLKNTDIEWKFKPSYYTAQVPFIEGITGSSPEQTDRYSQIDLYVDSQGQDLEITKKVSGDTEETDFDLTVLLCQYDGEEHMVPYKSTKIYKATLKHTDKSGTMTSKDYNARVYDSMILVYETDEDPDKAKFPKLQKDDILTVEKIIPKNEEVYLVAGEKYVSGYWHASVKVNDSVSKNMNEEFSFTLPDDKTEIKGLGNDSAVKAKADDKNTMEITNTFTVFTSFDILKHPELLFALLVALIALLTIVPFKFALNKKNNCAHNAQNGFIDKITGLFTEDFDL